MDNINHLMHRKENDTLEYKESFDKNKIAETMASFSTAKGGVILVGVDDDGLPLGITCDEDKIQRDMFDIKNNMNDGFPNVKLDFYNHTPTKKIIAIFVNEGSIKPYGWRGIYYKREGSTNKKLKPEEITSLNLISRNITFDGLKAQIYSRDVTMGDLDEEIIKAYVKTFNLSKRNKKMNYTTINNFLYNSNLYLNDGIKNAAMLLFGKDPHEPFPNSKINFLIYDGDVEDFTKLKQKRLIKGSLISQINEAIESIKFHTGNKVIMDGFRRIEINQYPLEAIREAIINAVAHRDYSIFDSFINIRLFENRLEIISPGKLVDGITLENIKKGGLSKRRNKSVCMILDNLGFMEQSGQGIKNIILALFKAGLKEPSITESDNFFKIEFYGQNPSQKNNLNLLGISTDLSNQLTPLQKLGLNKIQELDTKYITIKEYMVLIDSSSRITAKEHLDKFKHFGLLKPKKEGKMWVYHRIF